MQLYLGTSKAIPPHQTLHGGCVMKLYAIQARVLGLGWVTFFTARDLTQTPRLEQLAAQAGDRFPGRAPRPTRVLVDGIWERKYRDECYREVA